jgi:hypothetical protein
MTQPVMGGSLSCRGGNAQEAGHAVDVRRGTLWS